MTFEEKSKALEEKKAAIQAVESRINVINYESQQVTLVKGIVSRGAELKGLSILNNPPSGGKTGITLTFADGSKREFKTDSPNTLLVAALNKIIEDSEADILERKTAAEIDMDNLI